MKRFLLLAVCMMVVPTLTAGMVWEYLGAPAWEHNLMIVLRIALCALSIGEVIAEIRTITKLSDLKKAGELDGVDLTVVRVLRQKIGLAIMVACTLVILATGNFVTGVSMALALSLSAIERATRRSMATELAEGDTATGEQV